MIRHRFLATSFAVYLYVLLLRTGYSEDHVSVKWQDYQEDNDRIRVISRYVGFEKQINARFSLKGHTVYDSISGATPIGVPSTDGGESVSLSRLSDVRRARVVDLVWTQGINATNFQYSYSKESDYLSRGYSVSRTSEFNKRNTSVSYGLSYVDDKIQPLFFDEAREKESWDYFVGVSQVLDPNTVITFNLTYGEVKGYINDPYKRIRQDSEVSGGFLVFFSHPENRPESRYRGIGYFSVKRYFDGIGASLDADVRYFEDNWGVRSWTHEFEWYQKIGDKWIVRPNFRWYRQSAADFHYRDLTGLGFGAGDAPTGAAPYYASDYRLSEMETFGYGLKVVYEVSESIHLDASYEWYNMDGLDGVTSQAAYPDAKILTLGGTLWF